MSILSSKHLFYTIIPPQKVSLKNMDITFFYINVERVERVLLNTVLEPLDSNIGQVLALWALRKPGFFSQFS